MKKVFLYIIVLIFILSGCTSYSEVSELLKEKEGITEENAALEGIQEKIEAEHEDKNEIDSDAGEKNLPKADKENSEETTEEWSDTKENHVDAENNKVEHNVADDINSLPNDNSGWGFVKKKGAFPEFTKGQKTMMEKYSCIYFGNTEEKALYLTFDEGYENGYTGKILDILKEKGVPAAFFITGPYLEKNHDLIKRMVDEGHIVGNHTVNHPNMPSKVTKEAMQEEILGLDRKFYEVFGLHMTYFRPPEGAYSERSLSATNDLGYKTVLWSFAYKDWETDNQKGADYAFDSVIPYLHNGCVILLHAVSSDNTEALGRIIDEARLQGYTFKSLDEFTYQ